MVAERKHPRYAHEVSVTFHLGKKSVKGQTKNVSRGGLCADLVDAIEVGTEVLVDVVLVFDDGMHSEALRLPARIAWCTTVDDGHQVGVSFKPLDTERAKYLQMFLTYLSDERAQKITREHKSVDDRFR